MTPGSSGGKPCIADQLHVLDVNCRRPQTEFDMALSGTVLPPINTFATSSNGKGMDTSTGQHMAYNVSAVNDYVVFHSLVQIINLAPCQIFLIRTLAAGRLSYSSFWCLYSV